MTPPRPILRAIWAIHRALWAVSGHRIGTFRPGRRFVGTLFLRSTGRRTGTVRRNGLYYLTDGPNYAVVASNAGEPVDPQWWRNLQATPDAAIELGRATIPVRARRATPEEEARLWPRFDASFAEFARYRDRTAREIPIVILEPTAS